MVGDIQIKPIAGEGGSNYKFWASIGVALLVIELYTWVSWISGPYFTPTVPTEPMTDGQVATMWAFQIIAPILMIFAAWYWIVKPWREQGQLTTDGMLAITLTMLVFFDPTFNYASTALFYNSHFINFGAWTTSMPGWMSPNGHRLPEPLLVSIPGYLVAVFGQVVFVLWVMRKYKARRPDSSPFTMALPLCVNLVPYTPCLG